MYQRAVEADSSRACILGKYAVFLDNQKKDYSAAEAMYERAVETEPNHANNLANYAEFLVNKKDDYTAAEAMYERAVEADPKGVCILCKYSVFLEQKKESYKAADAMYQRAVEADSSRACILGKYAVFLDNQKQDYVAAEEMYGRAIEADPKHARNLGNYARLLFVQGNRTKAIKILVQAEQLQEKHPPDLSVELAFYRYAHCQPQPISPLKQLLLDGTRSLGWNLEDNVRRAEQDGHPNPALLAALAKVISDDQPIETLAQFEEWHIVEPTA